MAIKGDFARPQSQYSFILLLERPPHTFLAAKPLTPQPSGLRFIAPDRRDLCASLASAQHPEQESTEDLLHLRRIQSTISRPTSPHRPISKRPVMAS
jgi:hypothetical protein